MLTRAALQQSHTAVEDRAHGLRKLRDGIVRVAIELTHQRGIRKTSVRRVLAQPRFAAGSALSCAVTRRIPNL